MQKQKRYTLIVRGVTRDEKNSLKRMSNKSSSKLSVNQVLLAIIEGVTSSEISQYKKSKAE